MWSKAIHNGIVALEGHGAPRVVPVNPNVVFIALHSSNNAASAAHSEMVGPVVLLIGTDVATTPPDVLATVPFWWTWKRYVMLEGNNPRKVVSTSTLNEMVFVDPLLLSDTSTVELFINAATAFTT
jgi:hypothetical protein